MAFFPDVAACETANSETPTKLKLTKETKNAQQIENAQTPLPVLAATPRCNPAPRHLKAICHAERNRRRHRLHGLAGFANYELAGLQRALRRGPVQRRRRGPLRPPPRPSVTGHHHGETTPSPKRSEFSFYRSFSRFNARRLTFVRNPGASVRKDSH